MTDDDAEKKAVIAACETFIRDVLKPRFLPEVKPTKMNYLVDLSGKWAGGRYRFIQRLRSGWEENSFCSPCASLLIKCNRRSLGSARDDKG